MSDNHSDATTAPALLAIKKSKDRFEVIAKSTETNMVYQSEANFAMQSLQKNDYIFKVANNAPESVRNAVINIASIGLSLNPATSHAYLVPRNNVICLDISYQGLIKIATDTGSIRWAKAELVHANDEFVYTGVSTIPIHNMNPFKPRGAFLGVYCVAKTSDGDYLTEVMSNDDINEIKTKSEAYKAFASGKAKQCPWVDFFGEMAKKTCIKRASKTWPKSQRGDRLQHAIDILNTNGEGIDFTDNTVVETKSREQVELEQYTALCEMYADSIIVIKDAIAIDDYYGAAEAYYELSDETRDGLWKSTKNGGCFTTIERAFLKSDEFGRVSRQMLQEKSA